MFTGHRSGTPVLTTFRLTDPVMPLPPAPATPPSRQLPSAAPRQGGSLLEARAENTLHGISDHLIFNYDKNAIMRRVYLKSQFNSAANPLVFVLTRGNSLVWIFYGKLWEAREVREAALLNAAQN